MTAKKIEKILSQVFLRDYEMSYALYEHELVEILEELTWSMKTDKDDYIFTLTENRGHVAMLLIEKSGKLYINEKARERLKVLWPDAYASNMKMFIPGFARQLHRGELPINGVKVVDD